jgi:hypothetical protein
MQNETAPPGLLTDCLTAYGGNALKIFTNEFWLSCFDPKRPPLGTFGLLAYPSF